MTHLRLHKTPNLVSSEPGAAQRNKHKINVGVARLALPSLASHRGFSIRETDEQSCFIDANAVNAFGMIKAASTGGLFYSRPAFSTPANSG